MKDSSVTACFLFAVIAVFCSRSLSQETGSFWDVVRNPDAMPDLDQYHAEVEKAAAALSGSPGKVAQLVDHFVFGEGSSSEAWTELRILAKLEKQSYPRALEILRDPAMRDKLTVMTGESHVFLPAGPINRLCEIFDQDAPPPREAASLLSTFLQSESDEIRKNVALVIGSIGSTDSIPDLRRALSDSEEYVRSYALMGIQRAIEGDRIEESSQDEFFALVAGMWPHDTSFSVCDSIPLILLRLDRERAVELLLSDDLFTTRFEPVWRILEAFNSESVEVPRARLLAIIGEANKEPLDSVLEQALPLLGGHRNEKDLVILERFLEHENEDVSRGATEALYRFHRYYDLIRDPWEIVKNSGWNALTAAEKHICAIEHLDAEVDNGGFAQYFFNSSGDNWQDALNGLVAIGAKRRHQIMLATVEKFGDTKPAADIDMRRSQLAQVVRESEDPFNEHDSAWYDVEDENLDRLLFKYNLGAVKQ
jgi:HEAT repeat protein